MARLNALDILYHNKKSDDKFNFNSLRKYPMYTYGITPNEVMRLNNIATSLKYAGNMEKKKNAIKQILEPKGFYRFSGGTNREVFKFYEDPSVVFKIAKDNVGINDNPAEYRNQFLLAPFVSKMFETSPDGVIAMSEFVEPITSRIEFQAISNEVFNLLINLIGEYILSDIGTNTYMNYGLRKGFGPVLLDYPYLYKLDGAKLRCNKVDKLTNQVCNGIIDYDEGFNHLVCTKCGKIYYAENLRDDKEKNIINIVKEGIGMAKVTLTTDKGSFTFTSGNESKTIKRMNRPERVARFDKNKPLATVTFSKPVSTQQKMMNTSISKDPTDEECVRELEKFVQNANNGKFAKCGIDINVDIKPKEQKKESVPKAKVEFDTSSPFIRHKEEELEEIATDSEKVSENEEVTSENKETVENEEVISEKSTENKETIEKEETISENEEVIEKEETIVIPGTETEENGVTIGDELKAKMEEKNHRLIDEF